MWLLKGYYAFSFVIWSVFVGVQPTQAVEVTGAIPFQLSSPINGYAISGYWFPDIGAGHFVCSSGPAIFEFVNEKTGVSTRIATNSISLLTDNDWKENGIEDYTAFCERPESLSSFVSKFGSLEIRADSSTLAKTVKCEKGLCLQLGKSVVDFQDLDFDGKKELVFNHRSVGQRKVDMFEVHSIEENDDGSFSIDPLYDLGKTQPLSELDEMSTIIPAARRIEIYSSGGACASAIDVFERSREKYSGFKQTHRTVWETKDEAAECYRLDYKVSEGDSGFRKLKLISRKLEKP